jgi:hypothetical protein
MRGYGSSAGRKSANNLIEPRTFDTICHSPRCNCDNPTFPVLSNLQESDLAPKVAALEQPSPTERQDKASWLIAEKNSCRRSPIGINPGWGFVQQRSREKTKVASVRVCKSRRLEETAKSKLRIDALPVFQPQIFRPGGNSAIWAQGATINLGETCL